MSSPPRLHPKNLGMPHPRNGRTGAWTWPSHEQLGRPQQHVVKLTQARTGGEGLLRPTYTGY